MKSGEAYVCRKKTRSPGCGLVTSATWSYCVCAVRHGKRTPIALRTANVNPLQSTPAWVLPPNRYGVPIHGWIARIRSLSSLGNGPAGDSTATSGTTPGGDAGAAMNHHGLHGLI